MAYGTIHYQDLNGRVEDGEEKDKDCFTKGYQANLQRYKMPKGCEVMLEDYFTKLKRIQGDGWGNGRKARMLVENAILEFAARLARQKKNAGQGSAYVA